MPARDWCKPLSLITLNHPVPAVNLLKLRPEEFSYICHRPGWLMSCKRWVAVRGIQLLLLSAVPFWTYIAGIKFVSSWQNVRESSDPFHPFASVPCFHAIFLAMLMLLLELYGLQLTINWLFTFPTWTCFSCLTPGLCRLKHKSCSIASWKIWEIQLTKSNPKVAERILSIQPFEHGAEVMLDF